MRWLTVGYKYVGNQQFFPAPGTTVTGLMVKSTLWIIGILVVFVPLSVRKYRKTI